MVDSRHYPTGYVETHHWAMNELNQVKEIPKVLFEQLKNGTYVAPSSAPKKIATKQGIGRTLNDAGIRKTGYTYSSMVRGYSTQYSGWKSEETENGFKVNWVQSHQSSWGSRGKTPEQIAEHEALIAGHVETAVKKIFDALTAKGYDTSMDGQTILINNERNGQ